MEVVFASSAFRHRYTKQDFYELLAGDYLKIRSQRGLDEVYELLGRNLSSSGPLTAVKALVGNP